MCSSSLSLYLLLLIAMGQIGKGPGSASPDANGLGRIESIAIVENGDRVRKLFKSLALDGLESKARENRCELLIVGTSAVILDLDLFERKRVIADDLASMLSSKAAPSSFDLATLSPSHQRSLKEFLVDSPFGGPLVSSFLRSPDARIAVRMGFSFEFEDSNGKVQMIATGPWAPDNHDAKKEVTPGPTIAETKPIAEIQNENDNRDSLTITIRHKSNRASIHFQLRKLALSTFERRMEDENEAIRKKLAAIVEKLLDSSLGGDGRLELKKQSSTADLPSAQRSAFLEMMRERYAELGFASTKDLDAAYASGKIKVNSVSTFLGVRDSSMRGRFVSLDILVGSK